MNEFRGECESGTGGGESGVMDRKTHGITSRWMEGVNQNFEKPMARICLIVVHKLAS